MITYIDEEDQSTFTIFSTGGGSATLYYVGDAFLLRAKNTGLWYLCRLVTEGTPEEATLDIDQSPTAHPGGDIREDIAFQTGGSSYLLQLTDTDGDIGLDEFTSTGETGLVDLVLTSTDGHDYTLTVVNDGSSITHQILFLV